MVKLNPKTSPHNGFPRWLAAVLAMIVGAILYSGHWLYQFHARQVQQNITNELETIAWLKSDQIVKWRAQCLADVNEIVKSPFFGQGVMEWMESRSQASYDRLMTRFSGICEYHHYHNVLLVDFNGRVILSFKKTITRITPEDTAKLTAERAANEPKAFLTDLHFPLDSDSPVIDVIAPLYDPRTDARVPIAAVVLQIDPAQFLYPMIQSWPVPSRTAETLLVRREGNDVLFLNELRHRSLSACRLKIPLTQLDTPAVQAVLGRTGVFLGKDYRGQDVISVLVPVAESPWFLVAKIDSAEAFEQIQVNKWLLLSLVIGLTAATLAGAGLVWQYLRKTYYKEIYRAEVQRLALVRHYEYLVKYANDIILLIDDALHIVEVNDRAIETYGYGREEMMGMPVSRLVAPEDENGYQDRMRIIREKGVFLSEGIHLRKDGTRVPVEISARAIDLEGKTYLQAIVRDISERKQAEAVLRKEQEKFKLFVESAPFGIVVGNKQGGFEYMNPAFKIIFGYDLTDVPDIWTWYKKAYPDSNYRRHVISVWQNEIRNIHSPDKRPKTFCVIRRDGSTKFVNFIPFELETGQILVFCEDITEQKHAEDKLKESEERYRALFDRSLECVYIHDFKGNFIDANDTALQVLGYDRNDLKKYKLSSLLPKEDLALAVSLFKELMETGYQKQAAEFRVKHKYGHFVYLEAKASLVFQEGKPYAVQGIARDVTQRKKDEEELQKLAMVIHHSSELVNLATLEGQMVFLNQAGGRMLGIDPPDVTHHHVLDVIPESHWDIVKNEMLPALRSGTPWEGFLQYRNLKTGRLMDARAMTFPIKDQKTGKILWLANVSLDITAQVMAQKQLQESEARYRGAALATGHLIYDYEIETGKIHWAGAIEAITGFTPEEFAHVDIAGWEGKIHPQDRPATVQALAESMKNLKDFNMIYRFQCKDGQYIHVEDIGGFLADGTGKAVRMFGAMKNITSRIQVEAQMHKLEEQLQQAQKLESIGRLAGGVAHDFNNMLAIIIGYADILLKDLPETSPVREKTKEILKAAERARDLTRQLLAFARKQTLNMSQLELNQVVVGFEKMLRRTLHENIYLKIHLSSDPCFFQGDMGQVEQIILNIAINAQDAMPNGGTLSIETASVDVDQDDAGHRNEITPGRYVMLAISDTGVGMTRDVLEKIFDPFYTTKEVGKGTGLGLSTVYGIVKQHGGYIHVYSEPGTGTSFKIYFPQINTLVDQHINRDSHQASVEGHETLLVVEDDAQVRGISCEILKLHGYQVLDTHSGRQAIEIVKSHDGPIDLLITDVIMPDMNGKELQQQLAQTHPKIKTLFMSGYPEDVISHHGVLDPGLHFIQKPFSLHEFLAKVRQVLDSP